MQALHIKPQSRLLWGIFAKTNISFWNVYMYIFYLLLPHVSQHMDAASPWGGRMTSEAAVSSSPAISKSPAKGDYYWLRSFVAGGRTWQSSFSASDDLLKTPEDSLKLCCKTVASLRRLSSFFWVTNSQQNAGPAILPLSHLDIQSVPSFTTSHWTRLINRWAVISPSSTLCCAANHMQAVFYPKRELGLQSGVRLLSFY